ncbi:MAG: hypothetical protein MUD09_09115, partial [Desulfobacterales bacterium]|nr:hypothetical protein [Desulfobacterales bacterium]
NFYPKKTTLRLFALFLILLVTSIGLVLWKDRRLSPEQTIVEKSDSISDQPQIETDQKIIEGIPHENQENTKADEQEVVIEPEEQIIEKNHSAIKEEASEISDTGQQTQSATVNISGRTRLNAQISEVLTTKLKNFFALPHHNLGPVYNVIISGRVVVLRIEENWIEETQHFKSNIRVALRDFVYEDKNRKIERPDMEITVYARGMVEDMLPLAAQELMNKILNALLSDENDDNADNLPVSYKSTPATRN